MAGGDTCLEEQKRKRSAEESRRYILYIQAEIFLSRLTFCHQPCLQALGWDSLGRLLRAQGQEKKNIGKACCLRYHSSFLHFFTDCPFQQRNNNKEDIFYIKVLA